MSANRSRCDDIFLPSKKIKTEADLLEWLSKSNQLIPKKRNDFMKFIYKYFDRNKFPESVVKSVWLTLKTVERKIKESPTIVLSSDDEDSVQITEIIDFDELNSENEPNITVVQIPQIVPKTPERKKRESHKSPTVKVTKETSRENLGVAQDQALLKKFKQQIILEELLKRDKEMMLIQQRKDKFQSAVQIEIGYAKRIQKERVEALAQEMLRLHKEGFRDGLSPNSLIQTLCLVDPPQIIPSEHVIAELLPSPGQLNETISQELSNDQINYEMVYPSGESSSHFSSKSQKRTRRKYSDLGNRKRLKKTKTIPNNANIIVHQIDPIESTPKRSKIEIEADNLRRQLYIDELIEMVLPDVVEEVNGTHRLRLQNTTTSLC